MKLNYLRLSMQSTIEGEMECKVPILTENVIFILVDTKPYPITIKQKVVPLILTITISYTTGPRCTCIIFNTSQ